MNIRNCIRIRLMMACVVFGAVVAVCSVAQFTQLRRVSGNCLALAGIFLMGLSMCEYLWNLAKIATRIRLR